MPLRGVVADPAGLLDGSYVRACVEWWNAFGSQTKLFSKTALGELDPHHTQALVSVPRSDSIELFAKVAADVSLPTRQAEAVTCLAYAMAVVVQGAARSSPGDATVPTVTAPLTPEHVREIGLHYSPQGFAREVDQWLPAWRIIQQEYDPRDGEKIVEGALWALDDQIDRWGTAEGLDLRNSIGALDTAFTTPDGDPLVATFVDLLIEWGARLRVAESLVADGNDLRDLRYVDSGDGFDYTESFLYPKALERYREIASQQAPVASHIEDAARGLTSLMSDSLSTQQERLGFSTTVIRAYIWRSVENGPVSFMEPKLTEAIDRSMTRRHARGTEEPPGQTLFYAAIQCLEDGVHQRLGSIGGLIGGPRTYERALLDITSDYAESGIALDEETLRVAYSFGVALADSERVLREQERLFP